MKLPFDFANKLLLRLVLPGALLAATFWPVLIAVTEQLQIEVDDKVLAPIAIIAFGWLMLFLDMPLYMLAEGRRFWPEKLKAWCIARQAKRLRALQDMRRTLSGQAQIEIDLQIRTFPIDKSGNSTALYPTRLGNLIHAQESYPDRKYGIDGVFAWYRLWVSVDKDLRAELDDQQAIVDSALYASFVAGLAAVACGAYALIRTTTGDRVLGSLPSGCVLLALAVVCIVVGWLLYNACVMAQAQYGEIFCALFDQNVEKLKFELVLAELARAFSDPALASAPARLRAQSAIRFLKYHKYRPIGQSVNLDIREW
ncbi:hypothetical protein [Phenylobacterium sp.]|uniref:hypothetical protein n=1 Tax=Phenylobacterium sp. TaxID=1871053 RepID=UPI0035B30582